MKSIFKLIIAAAMACVFAACTEKPYGDEPQKKPEVTLNQNLDFTLAVLSVDEKTAQIKITHNGMTSDTWYGFHTSQVSESDDVLIQREVERLASTGKLGNIRKQTSATVNLTDLESDTDYKYIVFGLSSEGEVYGMYESVSFKTATGELVFKKNSAWKAEYLSLARMNGTLCTDVVSVTSTDDNSYLIIAVTSEDFESIGIKTISENIVAEYDSFIAEINAEYGTDYTIADFLNQGSAMDVTIMTPGNWYGVAIGVAPDGALTGLYAMTELITIEEIVATPEYAAWVGDWTLTGANGVTQDVTFYELVTNEFYAMTGYEGPDAEGLDVLVEWNAENGLWYIYNQNLGRFSFGNSGNADVWFAGMEANGTLYLSEIPLCIGGEFEDGTLGTVGYTEEWQNEDGSTGSYVVDSMLYLAQFTESGDLSYITGTYQTGYPTFPMTFTKRENVETRSADACKSIKSVKELKRTYKTFGSIR